MAGSPKKRQRRTRWQILADDPATLRELCDHLVEGGTLLEWCRAHDVRYQAVSAWISAEDHRRQKVDAALQLRGEFLSDLVIRNLRMYADVDVSKAYDRDGRLLPIQDMPEDLRRAIREFEVEEEVESHEDEDEGPQGGRLRRRRKDAIAATRTTKIKTVSPEKAIELLGKYRKLFTDRVEHSVDTKLEDLLTASRQPDPPAA